MSMVASMDLKEVVARLHKFASPWLSESWDNVGLLVEPTPPHIVGKLMLTNDLTEAVADEAVSMSVNMILSYHPPVFKPLKRLSQQLWKERIVVKCIENRIAVFSPHTCYDTLQGGVNDWLISPFGGKVTPVVTVSDNSILCDGEFSIWVTVPADLVDDFVESLRKLNKIALKNRLVMENQQVKLSFISSEKSLIEVMTLIKKFDRVLPTLEIIKLSKPPMPGYGQGRLTVLDHPLSLHGCVDMVKSHLHLTNIRLAHAVAQNTGDEVRSVAVCAGSGVSVLSGVQADLFITGELSHHDILDIVHSGTSVILCEHSNTERGFLAVLQHQLHSLFEGSLEICLSSQDKDPVEIV